MTGGPSASGGNICQFVTAGGAGASRRFVSPSLSKVANNFTISPTRTTSVDKRGGCAENLPIAPVKPGNTPAGFAAFPMIRPEWGCGRWRSTEFERGTPPKLSDEEIRAHVAKFTCPTDGNPPYALKRSELVKDLKEKVFPSRPVSFLAVTKDGKQVRVM